MKSEIGYCVWHLVTVPWRRSVSERLVRVPLIPAPLFGEKYRITRQFSVAYLYPQPDQHVLDYWCNRLGEALR